MGRRTIVHAATTTSHYYNRMPACEECHRVKARCDNDPLLNGDPCSRCLRLKVECIGRTSRQGQGPKKRRKKATNNNNTCKINNETEDGYVLQAQLENSNTGRHHFGVRYLIHSWTSFAFARRSFALLGKASRLAAKCQIPMDEVYCTSRRAILDPVIYNNSSTTTPTTKTAPYNQRLQWEDFPPDLLRVCNATTAKERENRYLMGRQAIEGHSRWFASELFEEQVASVWLMEETWKANQMPVVKLFLEGSESFDKFSKLVNYTISRYTSPGKLQSCRAPGFRIKFQKAPVIREMDVLHALQIVTLENSFYFLELVPSKADEGNNKNAETRSSAHVELGKKDTKNAECESANPHDDPLHSFSNLVPLEDMDEDFESFLALLNDD